MALAHGRGVIYVAALALLLLASNVQCHVRLDFPQARTLTLDFLDSARTPPPCGMPKGDSKTSFEAGTSFNATWHLGYPHQGGYKLELLDPNGKLMQTLTPEGGGSKKDGWLDEDTTAQRHLITLPDKECEGCTVRLLRTASEWGQSYRFWSCADIDIVARGTLNGKELCTSHGTHDKDADICVCDLGYFGSRCQYKDECETDQDCQNEGSCIDIDSTTSPRKQCFCKFGFFGQMCERKSEISQPVGDLSKYETRQLNDHVSMYWKILEGSKEIEVVVKAKTANYVAVGWRPRGTKNSCQAFPHLVDEISLKGDAYTAEAEPEVEPEGKAEPEVEPVSRAEPEPNAEPKAQAEPEAEYEGRAEPESRAEPEGKSESEGLAEPEVEAKEIAEPESRAEPEGKSEPEGLAEPEVEVKAIAEPESSAEPEGKSEPEGEPYNDKTPRADKTNKYQPKNDKIHPMDCTDIVIGMARGSLSRIYDAYTRDRSTPMPDSFYGGKEDLTSALGFEEEGMTTFVFRKKLEGSEETDHSLVDDLTHVIWAYGQTHGMYHHQPPSGLESGSASIQDFYRPDEVKYHGKGNRGVVTMNFFELTSATPCMSSWRFPKDCSTKNCLYEAKWKPVDDQTIEFNIRQKATANNDDWIAIGFSENTLMTDTDIVAGFSNVIGGGAVKDFWASRYASPELDSSQDVIDGSVKLENGFRVMTFKRKFNTGDKFDINLTNDIHLVFPYSGGPMFGSETLGKHKETPFVTDTKINLNQVCEDEPPNEPESIPIETKLEGADVLLNSLIEPAPEVEPEAVAEPKGFDDDIADEGSCQQSEWRYPEGCSESDCEYMAKWTKSGDNIKVSVQGKSNLPKQWIGIGFSTNPFMARTDAVIGYVDESGQGVVKDVWISSYNPPDEDDSQDIKVLEIGKKDNVTFMKFLKKFSSDDREKDVDFNKDVHILFPYSGGPVIAAGTIGKHLETPEVTPEKVNFNALCDKRVKPTKESTEFPVKNTDDSSASKSDAASPDLFSCSSSSNKSIKSSRQPGPVTFDECQLDLDNSLDESSGMFKPSQDGLFSLSAMALLKSDVNSAVLMSLIRVMKNGRKETIMSTMATSSSSDSLGLIIGTSTTLTTIVELQQGENVYLEVYSEGKSGLINSDWHVLKFSGYRIKNDVQGLSCDVIDTTRDSVLTISNCFDTTSGSGFGPKGLGRARTDQVSVYSPGFYRIAFSGNVETFSESDGPTMLTMDKDKDSVVASAAGYFKVEEKEGKTSEETPMLSIPIGFLTYDEMNVDSSLKLRLKNRGNGSKSATLKNGHVTIMRESEDAQILYCTNNETIQSKAITFTSCRSSKDVMGKAVDLETGVVTIPEDGYYEISFTGALKTFAGKRIWITIVKKKTGSKDEVLGAGFSTVYFDETFASIDMTASSTVTTIEKLKTGEQIAIVMGRRGIENHIKGSDLKTINFTLKKV